MSDTKKLDIYYNLMNAPEKQFRLVEGCGHSPQYDAPEELYSCFSFGIAV